MIKTLDLKSDRAEIGRVMVCQLDSKELTWQKQGGLYHLIGDEKIELKISSLLKIAQQHTVDMIVFPELAVPENMIEKLRTWSQQQNVIVIGGSHYVHTDEGPVSRSPIIINGENHFTYKIHPAPIEKSPVRGEGLVAGPQVLKIKNSALGNIGVLICSDYLNDEMTTALDLGDLDILCVPAFQRLSEVYHRRMTTDVESSKNGLYIVYSNFIDEKFGEGKSALFGTIDRMFFDKLVDAGLTDKESDKKLIQLGKNAEYAIFDLNLTDKRPFANRNLFTDPNVTIIAYDRGEKEKELTFLKKIAHDDERYKRLDELYVEPREFGHIVETLEQKNLVIIVGDPGIGKTYTAAKLLKQYYLKGYEPVWFSGLEKEDRDTQTKVMSEFTPSDKQIVYFEDPFGRTAFEKRDSLYQFFGPLLDKLVHVKSKIIITSRKEIFERFEKETLMAQELLDLKSELNVRNPSYEQEDLVRIFDKLGSLLCSWFENEEIKKEVYKAIADKRLSTPLAIRELVFVSKNITTIEELRKYIARRSNETVKDFALDIRSATMGTKLLLYLIFFSGMKWKAFLTEKFILNAKQLNDLGYNINVSSFPTEIRGQLGYRVEQIGANRSAYKFTHPVYEESLAILISMDKECEVIAKQIITTLGQINPKPVFLILNRLAIKFPQVALLLFQHLLDLDTRPTEVPIRTELAKNLIGTYFSSRNEQLFDLARSFYDFEDLIADLNGKDEKDIIHKLELLQRYLNNSPDHFDLDELRNLDWQKVFSKNMTDYLHPQRLLVLLQLSKKIDPDALSVFITIHGTSAIQKAYLLLTKKLRENFYKLFRNHPFKVELRELRTTINTIEAAHSGPRKALYKKVLFSEGKFLGTIVIDTGARNAIKRSWVNLLPAGITRVHGKFDAGSIVSIVDEKNTFIGVGIVEYSSYDLSKIMRHSSNEFLELIGYFHSSAAIRGDFLLRSPWEVKEKDWKYVYGGLNKNA